MFISIIIPLFNSEKYVAKTIESLIIQTNKNFEIVLIDDGSTDNSLKISLDLLRKSKFLESNIKSFIQPNKGVSYARNKGIKESKGDYLVFLDGDDFLDSRLIETLYNTKKDEDIICWGFNKVDEEYKTIDLFQNNYSLLQENYSGTLILKKIISEKTFWIWTSSLAIKRDLLNQFNIFFTPNCINGEDQELIFKCLLVANHIFFINDVYSFYVKRKGSITTTYNIKKFDVVYAIERVINFNSNYCIEKDSVHKINISLSFHLLSVFFETFSSLLLQSNGKKRNLIKKMRLSYPKLIKLVSNYARRYWSNNLIINIKLKIFSFFPFFYLNNFNVISNL